MTPRLTAFVARLAAALTRDRTPWPGWLGVVDAVQDELQGASSEVAR